MKRRICIALTLLLALAAPAALLAAEAPAQPASSSSEAASPACAPAPSVAQGLSSPAAASPIETPWDRAVELTSCDCSGFNCGPGCYPYVCVLLHGHCGAICKCVP